MNSKILVPGNTCY